MKRRDFIYLSGSTSLWLLSGCGNTGGNGGGNGAGSVDNTSTVDLLTNPAFKYTNFNEPYCKYDAGVKQL